VGGSLQPSLTEKFGHDIAPSRPAAAAHIHRRDRCPGAIGHGGSDTASACTGPRTICARRGFLFRKSPAGLDTNRQLRFQRHSSGILGRRPRPTGAMATARPPFTLANRLLTGHLRAVRSFETPPVGRLLRVWPEMMCFRSMACCAPVSTGVIAGLDPAIHRDRGLALPWTLGSSPRATLGGAGKVRSAVSKHMAPSDALTHKRQIRPPYLDLFQ